MSAPTPEPLTPERLREIAERAAAATAGPWCSDSAEIHQGAEYVAGALWIGETCRVDDADGGAADAAFVAAARADVPDLLAEVTRLRAEVDQLRDVELVGVNLALYEEQQDTARLRVANRNARERAARWRGDATVLGNTADYATEQAAELRDELAARPSRAEVLREVAETTAFFGDDAPIVRAWLHKRATQAEAGTPTPEPLIVSRFDVAIEPAPEEDPVLTIGCIAEGGRPVALLLDPEARRKVHEWTRPGMPPLGAPRRIRVVSTEAGAWRVRWRIRDNRKAKSFASEEAAHTFAAEPIDRAARMHAARQRGEA
ncbi:MULTISPECIES: hypothetical protein [unclassified Streptomyces]|uniref:hypothetical protein n=1 Tax=unclassified Streptomyces TaxID=2593676 RepID=UPI00081F5864|nr:MULTISPECIES: hypothetical protein [unclassified Streptomyces]MYR28648.1 hypothetical protein [Streptomyces sp. SID4945]SCF40080.1 hypothetical protein GA0115257_11564 [Streptomyces sp. LcepLS]